MKRWDVCHSSDGFTLHAYDTPWWAVAAAELAMFVDLVAGRLIARFTALYRPWNALACVDLRHATDGVRLPLDPATALAMSRPGDWDYVDA